MEGGRGAKRSGGGDIVCLDATELRLGLPGSAETNTSVNKRALLECRESKSKHETTLAAKAQVVGWPPVLSYRRNTSMMKKKEESGVFVKVSMDGAPYLRKIDLKVYKGYKELREALENMFKNFSLGDLLKIEGYDGCEHAITYEDKDGDWMLAGDVPWELSIHEQLICIGIVGFEPTTSRRIEVGVLRSLPINKTAGRQ